MAEVTMAEEDFTEKKVQSYMVEFRSFLALNPSINSPIFLYLVNIIQARCLQTTHFWMTGYAALPPLSPDGRQELSSILVYELACSYIA
ncbi:hypothetical protein [Acidithiobacillus sulfuriphilus]|uniref:Uncharacterized protein n=2 Tax=Acidithiobacillus sulfuriphilus TaxID=1867749 RepID=A0A3M8S796_9PROT|nr:hypothetical protein [Acidithiobacillus sulfuriphilus]RNF76781.1 hypothetical protein EC580_00440 [Acidithiobacillus sulfuriphilus]